MKNILLSTLAAGALTAAALGLTTTAGAAPAGPSDVDTTINQLRAQGFDVVVNRTGTAALEQPELLTADMRAFFKDCRV